MLRSSLLIVTAIIFSPSLALGQVRADEINPQVPVISSYREALEASSDEIFRDFEQYRDWERRFYSLPGVEEISNPDALQTYMEMQLYAESRAAAMTGILADDRREYGLRLLNKGKELQAGAELYGEIQANGGFFLHALDRAKRLITDPYDTVLGDARKDYHTDRYLRVANKEVLRQIDADIQAWIDENGFYEANLEAIRTKLNDAKIRFEEAASDLERNAVEPDQDNNSPTKNEAEEKAKLISTFGDARDPASVREIADKAEEGGFDDLVELIDAAGDFAIEASKYTEAINGVANAAVGLGVDIPEDANKAINIAASLTNGIASFATGNYIGAAMSLVSAFGPKKPDPAALRFQAIMGRLDTVMENQEEMLANQDIIISNQEAMFRRIDELEWVVRDGFADLERALQEATELIVEAIFREDDRDIGRCLISGVGARMSFFPRLEDVQDVANQPSGTFLTENEFQFLTSADATIHTRVEFFDRSFGQYLEDCRGILVYILEGLQTGRGVDPYFRLSRIDDLKANDAAFPTAKRERVEQLGAFAVDYREILENQAEILEKWADQLKFGEDQMSNTEKFLLAAFNPPYRLNCISGPFCTLDDRIAALGKDQSTRIQTYFRGPGVHSPAEVRDKVLHVALSAPTLFYVSQRLLEVHPYLALAKFDGSPVTEFPAERSTELELSTYRLLLETNRLIEVLRAQQSIMDGRAHVGIAWKGLFSDSDEVWSDIFDVFERNAQFEANVTRYIFYRALKEHAASGLREYEIAMGSQYHLWVNAFLQSVFAQYGAEAALYCAPTRNEDDEDEVAGERETCSEDDLGGIGKATPMLELNIPAEGGGMVYRTSLRLPSPNDLLLDQFAENENSRLAHSLHTDYRNTLASYRPAAFFEAPEDADDELTKSYAIFSDYMLGARMADLGFKIPQ